MQDQLQLVLDHPQKEISDRSSKRNLEDLPPIPDKRYFSIGEVSKLCLVKPHVLRYWEQEFSKLSPDKRRGSRRYYQRHEILLVRRIKDLLYKQGFTIEGAKSKLSEDKKESHATTTKTASVVLIQDVISELKKIAHDLDRG